jgi:Histidine kinase-, DNA gyrase B-, and HSP90-like ATPase/DJ-1/PfpI family
VDNAVRHAKSRVDIHVGRRDSNVILTVSDDGPGIAPTDRARVFERFVRLDSDRARSGGGTGLGLAIVAEVVAAHGGTVNIDDRPGDPGGHGPMEDVAYDRTSGALLTHRLASGRPLALLCHAPAAILAATGPDGKSPFAGRRMTGLSNREELLNRFAKKAPWLLQDKLKEAGVVYSKGFPLRPHTVVDGNLYTGQNPQSSEKLAERLVADVRAASSN